MGFLAPRAPTIPDPATPPSPTDEAVRRQAEIARSRRVRSGRASTILNPEFSTQSRSGALLNGAARQGAAGGGFTTLAPSARFKISGPLL